MGIKTVGDRISTEKYDHIYNNEIRSFITPKIQINGKMVYINDKTTVSGLKEFQNRAKAREEARFVRDSLKGV